MAFKDVLVWCSWWVWGDKGLSVFQCSAYKKTRARTEDIIAPFDDAHSKMNREVSVNAVVRNLCLLTICEGKGHRPGFCHSPWVLSYLSIANPAAGFSEVLKITVLLKHVLGLSGSGTCASGCVGTSVSSSGDQIDHFRYQVMCKCSRTWHVMKPLILGFPFSRLHSLQLKCWFVFTVCHYFE